MKRIIFGFLRLVIIYRDYVKTNDGDALRFLPWLHSTEVAEHVFGICRQLIKDFTILDFYFMVPKNFVILREHLFRTSFSDGKNRAAGYNHTYGDCRALSIAALSLFPSDRELAILAEKAYGETDSLIVLLGASSADLRRALMNSAPRLLAFRTWLEFIPLTEIEDAADEEEIDPEWVDADEEAKDKEEPCLQEVLGDAEVITVPGSDHLPNSRLNSLRCAAIALSTEQENQMYVDCLFDHGLNVPSHFCCSAFAYLNTPKRTSTKHSPKTLPLLQTRSLTFGLRTNRRLLHWWRRRDGGVNHWVDDGGELEGQDEGAYETLDEILQEIDEAGLLERKKRIEAERAHGVFEAPMSPQEGGGSGRNVEPPKKDMGAFALLMAPKEKGVMKKAEQALRGYGGHANRTKRLHDKAARDRQAEREAAKVS